MHELLTEILSQARSAWRFRWYGIAAAWVVGLGGWTFVALMPDVYEASTRVYVDTTSILRPLLNNSIVATDVPTRLQFVRQALLGREYLERLITKNSLDTRVKTPQEREMLFERLRREIVIDAASARDEVSRDNSSVIFTIKYQNENPQTAVSVVTDLLNFLIEDTLSSNREQTDSAESFLDERIAEYEARLQQKEQELADFQRQNAGRLPGSEGTYFERIQREQEAIQQAERQVRIAESRKLQLQKQLAGEAPVLASSTATQVELRPDSIDARIRDNRAQLDRLLLDFTDAHPDVIALRETLKRLEGQRAEQLRALGIDNPDQQISALGSNPVYQALQIALNDVQVEIATLQADVADRQRRLATLNAAVNEVPEVEANLQRLTRDYDDIRRQYQLLIQSRETQMLSRKASEADQVEFPVLDPPNAGFAPVAPKRLLMTIGVLLAALAAGGGLSYLLAQIRPVFSSMDTLSRVAGLPVLGTVNRVIVNAAARQRQQFEHRSFVAALSSLVLASGLLIVLEMAGFGLRKILVGA